jgi:hypothetical protein
MVRSGLMAMLALAGAQAFAQPSSFPKVDPMDVASCEVEGGWMTVFNAYATALYEAMESNRIVDPLATELSLWYLRQQNRILETNDVKGVCRDTIAVRRQHGF